MPRSKRWTERGRDDESAPRQDRGWLPGQGDRLLEDEIGSAALEFILVGLVLLVPVVYLIIALGLIQGQALGVEAGARHVARTVSTAPDAATAAVRADAVIAVVTEEYGIDSSAIDVSIACRPVSASCPSAGATVVVTVATRVSLPLVPEVLGLERLASIPVEASAAQKVSRFWSAP
ncbi:TadE family protein [Microbacterium sp. P02]|uniref:TadE family protein n=1 Tax=unclassified Microbacterium TaxID=2609290 RepID=UPI00366DC43B